MKNGFGKLCLLVSVLMQIVIIFACSRSLPSHSQASHNKHVTRSVAATGDGEFVPRNLLDGTWISECRNGEQYSYTFNGSSYVYVKTVFSAAGCNSLTALSAIRIYGQMIVGEMVDEADYRIIDYGIDRVGLKPLNQWTQGRFSKDKKCGVSDWKVGNEQDITNLSCQLEAVGDTTLVMYNIVKISDQPNIIGKFRLWFGDTSGNFNGSVPSLRPRTLASYSFMN